MPFKDFANGEEALADDIDTYLMSQAVARFANASARSGAAGIPAPVKGQCSTRDDAAGVLEMWDGTAWTAIGSPYSTSAWSTYTPTWRAGGSTSGLAIGTGGTNPGVSGSYRMVAPYLLAVNINIRPGTTGFNGGSGIWDFTLPPGASLAASTVGSAVVQSAAGQQSAAGSAVFQSFISALSPGPAGGSVNWSATAPVTWSNNWQGLITGIVGIAQRWI